MGQRFRITYEPIAVVAYPVIAGGYLLIQTVRFPSAKCQYLANNLANILMPGVTGPVSAATESGVSVLVVSIHGREKAFPPDRIYQCSLTYHGQLHLFVSHRSGFGSARSLHSPKQPQFRHRPVFGVLLASLLWAWTVEMVLFVKLLVYATHGLLPIYDSLLHHITFPVYLFLTALCGPMTVMPIAVTAQCLIEASERPTIWIYFDELRSDAMESWRRAKGRGRDTTFRLV